MGLQLKEKSRWFGVAVVALLVLAGCGSDEPAETPDDGDPEESVSPVDTDDTPDDADAAGGEGYALPASLEGRSVTVGLDPNIPPLAQLSEDNPDDVVGAEVDMFKEVLEYLGLDYEIMPSAWSGLLPALQAGQIDVMWSILYYTPERAEAVDFVTYMRADTGVLVPEGNPQGISSVEDLCGVRGAATVGTVEEELYEELSAECEADGLEPIETSTYQDPAATVRAVQNDRADVATYNAVLVSQITQEVEGVELGFIIPGDTIVAAAVDEGDDDLLDALLDGVKWLQDSGRQAEIMERWGIPDDLIEPAEILRD